METNPEKIRIGLAEFLGWSELSRFSKLGIFRALRGVSPDGVKNCIAPNFCLSYDSLQKVVEKLDIQTMSEYSSFLMNSPYSTPYDRARFLFQKIKK